jgi:heat-inducible transcriptional repressor
MSIEDVEGRSWLVLKILIKEYIAHGEPIASEEIASKMPYEVSSATVRSELSKLESQGFLIRPYVSSGRIPSYRGYRRYIDSLLGQRRSRNGKIPFQVPSTRDLEAILKSASNSLSKYTQTVSVVLFPLAQRLKLKSVHLVAVPTNKVLLIMVINADDIREYILTVTVLPDQNLLNSISSAVLNGIRLNPSWTPIQLYSHLVREHSDLVLQKDLILNILQLIREVTSREVIRILKEGAHRLLRNPTFSGDTKDMHHIVEMISMKEMIKELLLDTIAKDELDIVIGSESSIPELKGFVYIGKPYRVDEAIGVISLIGPLRMNYNKSFNAVGYLSKVVEETLLQE